MSKKLAVICGYGSGIGDAAVKAFAKEGFQFALLARTKAKLDTAVETYAKDGITAKAFAVDLSDHKEVTAVIEKVHSDLGSISLVIWNALSGNPCPIVGGSADKFLNELVTGVVGLQAACSASLEDLKANKGSLLVTGGAFGLDVDGIHDYIAAIKVASAAVNKAAQRKWVAVAFRELKEVGVHAAELSVANAVRGTKFDPESKSTLGPDTVGKAYVELYHSKDKWTLTVTSD